MVSQKMMRFLKEINIPIRLSCISESDYPIVISLMYIYFDEKFFCATQNNSKIIGYLKRNSKCGFEIAGDSPPYRGVREYGNAAIYENEGEKILCLLLQRYFKGKESSQLYILLLSRKHLEAEVAIEINPTRMFEWDYTERMKDLA